MNNHDDSYKDQIKKQIKEQFNDFLFELDNILESITKEIKNKNKNKNEDESTNFQDTPEIISLINRPDVIFLLENPDLVAFIFENIYLENDTCLTEDGTCLIEDDTCLLEDDTCLTEDDTCLTEDDTCLIEDEASISSEDERYEDTCLTVIDEDVTNIVEHNKDKLKQVHKKLDKELDKDLNTLDKAFRKEFKIREYKYIKKKDLPGFYKRFEEELLIKYDLPAREKIKKTLGDFVSDNPNLYEQDLLINSKTCRYKYLEIQVCSNWITEKFPHQNVYIYARKAKYGRDTLFLTLNRFLTRGFLFDGKSHEGVKPRRFKKYSRQFIYDIPWSRVMPILIDQLDRETIEMY